MVQTLLHDAVCRWRRHHACPVADNGGTTCLAAHCARRSALSVLHAVTQRVELSLDQRQSVVVFFIYDALQRLQCLCLRDCETWVPDRTGELQHIATLYVRHVIVNCLALFCRSVYVIITLSLFLATNFSSFLPVIVCSFSYTFSRCFHIKYVFWEMRFRGQLMRFRKTTCKSCKTTA